MSGRFSGKVALISGGNSGIGAAVAAAFVAEGGNVMLASRDLAKSQAVADSIGSAAAIKCDVQSAGDCMAAVEATLAAFGRIDVLFNNAGVIVRDRDVPTTTEDEWDLTMNVNAKGTFLLSKAALPHMSAGSSIINNASIFGLVGGRGTAAYNAAKGAVVLLTKAMALDHAAEGIRVNCVCPGSIETPMLKAEFEAMGGADKVRHEFEQKHPQGRIGDPEEVAQAVLFLASDEASFITGAALPIDGGRAAG